MLFHRPFTIGMWSLRGLYEGRGISCLAQIPALAADGGVYSQQQDASCHHGGRSISNGFYPHSTLQPSRKTTLLSYIHAYHTQLFHLTVTRDWQPEISVSLVFIVKRRAHRCAPLRKKKKKKPQFQSGYSIIYYSRFQSPTAMPELFCCEHVTYKLQRPASTTWANHHSCTTPPLGLHQTGQSSAKGDISSPAQAAQVETMFDQTITKLRGQINNSPLSTQLQPVSSSPNSPWRSTALCCYRHDALSAQRRPCILYSRLKCWIFKGGAILHLQGRYSQDAPPQVATRGALMHILPFETFARMAAAGLTLLDLHPKLTWYMLSC